MPSRLDAALERLGKAVARLEQAGHARLEALVAAGGDGDGEASRLSAELNAMRTDYQELQLTSRHASGRIDAAIGRLRAVLEMP